MVCRPVPIFKFQLTLLASFSFVIREKRNLRYHVQLSDPYWLLTKCADFYSFGMNVIPVRPICGLWFHTRTNTNMEIVVVLVVVPYSLVQVLRSSRGACCLHRQVNLIALMVKTASISKTLVNYQITRRNNLENSYRHTRSRENLVSHLWPTWWP
jgi:hypothetical protein